MITEEKVDSFLEHHGVKGMKWGQRRAANKEARIKRLKAGKGSLKDKLIRDLDIGGTRTAIVGPASKKKRAGMAVVGAGLMGLGVVQVNNVLRQTGHIHISQLPKYP